MTRETKLSSLNATTRRRETSSKRGKTRGGEKPIDAQALRKKVSSVTCGPAARAILSSLLLYVTDLQDRPPGPPPAGRAEGVQGKAGRSAESQDAHRRPTCFQLLQAKFMGTGREPRLKKAREVGRLISKDKQGPSRSLVTATINKLLEKAREGAGRPARDREPPPSQKPRQGLPAGKGTVKNILKLFLAAEEKAVCEQPAAARGPPPKPAKRGSVLSKLREKFERSGCLCSEAGVLPLRPERRKESLARRRMHRPETRVLRTATLASTCIGTPLARFLACTAEPVLAFSIATVVCGPRSWLSHCTKISHARHSREPRGAAGVFPGVGRAGDRRGQPDGGPAQLPVPWATAPGDSREMALPGEGPKPMPGPAPSPASHRAGALAGREPEPSPRKPAGPGRARAAGGARTGDSPAGDAAQHTMAPSEAGPGLWPGLPGTGAGRAPEVALTVCSSEDETEGVSLGSEGDPLFAVQETFPEQKVAAHIPPLLVPAVQALRGAQSAPESLHVTVTWPDTYQMPPAPTTLPKATESPQVTVPQLDSYPVPPAPATLPKATESPRVTVPRLDSYPVPPAPAMLPKAMESPQVTVPQPDTYPVPPAPATLPKATESPQVTVPQPDTYLVPPAPTTLPKASGARDRGSSLLSSGGGGRGGLESTRVPFPTGTGGENTRAVSTVEGPLKALSVPPARGATSTGQDLPMAALQQRPACRMANSLGFEDSKELWHPEGLAGGDASELACEKLQGPASGDRPVRGGDAPWHHLTASGNRQTGDSPSGPGRQRELPAQAGHPVGVSAVPGVTPSNRTRSDSPTAADEGVQCGRELGGPPRRASAQPGVQAARGTSPGLGGHRPTPLSGRPPGAPRRAAATGATESHTAPVARDIPKPVNSTAGERNPVHDGGGRPPPTHPSLAAAALAGASDPPHGSTRAGPREHLLESNACGGSGQRWLETPESLAAAPLRAAGTPLGPRVSVTAKSKADTVAAGRGAPAVHGSPRGEDMTRVPRGAPPTPRGGAAVGPPPSENQQAEEDKRVLPKLQVPPGAGAPRQPPAPGAPGGQWVCGAPQKGPDPQAHPPSASLTRAGVQDGVEVGDRRPPQAGLGALVEGAAGPVRPDGALDKGVALCGQKSRSCAAKAGQTRPGEVEVGHGAEVGATEVGTGHQCTEKGPEHARGQQARRAENPPRGHSAPAGENQAPSPLEKPGRPAQPQAGRRAPCSSAGPANSSSEAVPTVGASGGSRGPAPRGSQAEHGAPHQGGESQPAVGRSPRSPSPEPGGWEMPCAAAQEGPPNTPQAESSVLERGHHRRRAQFAKYRAQSFGDQRSFDLSFRPTVIRANDTFELPK